MKMNIQIVRRITGSPLKIIATIVYFGTGLVGLFLCLTVLHDMIGFLGIVLGLMFFPVMIYAIPWYMIIHFGDPSLLIYGGVVAAGIIYFLGSLISGD